MPAAVPQHDRVRFYNRLAPDYDRLHQRWLRHAGGEAQAALEAAVRALVTPDMSLLDAGCGTGAFARTLMAEGICPSRMTLLDPSDAMLTHCLDLPARSVKGRIEALPFNTYEFDLVTCAWALETCSDAKNALLELCRVVRLGGVLCLAFCAKAPSLKPAAWLMRQSVKMRGAGQFLSRNRVIEVLRQSGEFEVRSLPSNGPAAALLAKRCAVPAAMKMAA